MIILIFNPRANSVLVYNEKFEGEKKFGRFGRFERFVRFLKFERFERLVLLAPVSKRDIRFETDGYKSIQQQTN